MAENEVKEKNGKKRVMAFLLLGALAVGAVGGAYAFFTSRTDQVQNTFTIAEGDNDPANAPGELDESPWDPTADHTNLQPNEIVAKAPKYTHKRDWDGIVYMEVTVPVITKADADAGNKKVGDAVVPKGIPQVLIDRDFNQDLFDKLTLNNPAQVLKTNADKWEYVGCRYVNTNSTPDNTSDDTYVAAANVDTEDYDKFMYILRYVDPVTKDFQTSAAFDEFQVLNYTKYTASSELSVDVQLSVVQSEGFKDRTDYLALYNEVFTGEGTDDDALAPATFTVTIDESSSSMTMSSTESANLGG